MNRLCNLFYLSNLSNMSSLSNLFLAFKNLRKNFSFYALYLLSVSLVITVYFAFASFSVNYVMLEKISSDGRVESMCHVISVFLTVFVIFYMSYSNRFFLRRRMKELGIYALLGYRKTKILSLLVSENILIGSGSLIAGLLLGAMMHKGIVYGTAILLHLQINNEEIPFFHFKAVTDTVVFISLVICVMAVSNAWFLFRTPLIDLIRFEKSAEKRRKAGKVPALLGFLLIIAGYGLALDIFRGFDSLWFTAGFYQTGLLTALLIVTGTALFIASFLPFAAVKSKQHKKTFYTETRIVTVPNFIYRIRSNTKTLIMLSLLSAATLTVSSVMALSLFYPIAAVERIAPSELEFRIEERLMKKRQKKERLPNEGLMKKGQLNTELTGKELINEKLLGKKPMNIELPGKKPMNVELPGKKLMSEDLMNDVKTLIRKYASDDDVTYIQTDIFKVTASAKKLPMEYSVGTSKGDAGNEKILREAGFECISYSQYVSLLQAQGRKDAVSQLPSLQDGECILVKYQPNADGSDETGSIYFLDIQGGSMPLTVKAATQNNPISFANSIGTLIVSDAAYGQISAHAALEASIISINGAAIEDNENLFEEMSSLLDRSPYLQGHSHRVNEIMSAGGPTFLLIGFLVVLFFIATGSILYFNNISAVSDSKADYEILSKMGYSDRKLKKILKKQVLTFFSIPFLFGFIDCIFATIVYKTGLMQNLLGNTITLYFPAMAAISLTAFIYLIYYCITVHTCCKIVLKH